MKIAEMDLVFELRKRNEKALCLLIDIYGGLIKSIIRKHVQQPDACDECMDDILFSIWNNIDKYYEEKNSFKNWVVAIS
ncbi:DNA-directed RNA polymerase specialized sigma24 family protein [Paenibacillus sp. V4I3]|uniref:sigma factor n=1 Tax=Paenibacillus sp. V4I3 TaxID=3042305 RepID=UPI00277D200C|nr:sigma factor [Paenibacillus sp. V4I3]MDQ0876542.1 DNA-directed RNA polymerase specialized sigma24 family protein [Paenibacillus sp. V4I3]